jgi:hypothetical protein
LGIIRRDSRGYALSLDLLLALIPLTIILGMVGADMDNMLYNVQDTVFRSSMDRVAVDTVNALLETSGTPPTWEQNGTSNIVVGLAQYDSGKNMSIKNSIDPAKLNALTTHQSYLQNLVGNQYNFNITITNAKTNSIVNTIGNNFVTNSSIRDVVKVERIVLYSKYKIVAKTDYTIRDAGASRTYTSGFDPAFTTTQFQIDNYEYWIVFTNGNKNGPSTFSSATVKINDHSIVGANINTTLSTNTSYKIDPTFLNSSLPQNSISLTPTVTPSGEMNFFIIQAPIGTQANDVSYSNVAPQECRFFLYLWTR